MVPTLDLHPLPASPGGALPGRVQQLESELAAAHETIRRLRQSAQEAEQTVQRTQAQMLMYATDLHQMYMQEHGRMAELEGAVLDLLMGLVHIVEARDPYTGSHTARVARYARAIATVLGWNEDQLATLELGAQLHDVGKIGIADEILRKPGPLTREEYREMQTHVAIGLRILGGVRVLGSIMPFVAYHHERIDGKGYPFGLAGPAIPLEGRLLAVADAFDAITSERPYRAARSLSVGLAELDAHRGTQFDPEMVEALKIAHEARLLDVPVRTTIYDGLGTRQSSALYLPWLTSNSKVAFNPPTLPDLAAPAKPGEGL